MNYYISDLHFGWKNKFENRTLDTDKIIKENWNKIITNADDVYILGDIGKEGRNNNNEYLCEIISTLRGRKHLIVGNHDKLKDQRIKQLFVEICDYKYITDNFNGKNYKVVLTHYPILFWQDQHKGSILLYGHLHNTDEEYIFKKALNMANEYFENKTLKGYTDCPTAKAFNVGAMMDYVNYTPVTLKQLLNKE